MLEQNADAIDKLIVNIIKSVCTLTDDKKESLQSMVSDYRDMFDSGLDITNIKAENVPAHRIHAPDTKLVSEILPYIQIIAAVFTSIKTMMDIKSTIDEKRAKKIIEASMEANNVPPDISSKVQQIHSEEIILVSVNKS